MEPIYLVRGLIDELVKDKVKCTTYNPENIVYVEATLEDGLIIKKIKCQITEPRKCICNCEP